MDICNKNNLMALFKKHKFYAVIHFAGLKSVGESVKQSLKYYDNNIIGTIYLLEVFE